MPARTIVKSIADMLPHGGRVLWHAAQSECRPLLDAFRANPEAIKGLTFAGLFIPGVNTTDLTEYAADIRMESIFIGPAHRKAFAAGRMDLLPMHYSNYPDYCEHNPADLAILHLPPPRNGIFSCGPTADIAESARRSAKKIIVIINPQLPFTHGGVALRADEADAIFEMDSALPHFPSDPDDAVTLAIARHVANLVRDGDTVQCGIGRVSASILRALANHRNLRIFSGMVIDEIAELAARNALASGSRAHPSIIAGIAIGTRTLMDFIRSDIVAFHGNRVTHNPLHIARQQRFTAINSAIEVDLTGQVNCEFLDGKQVSGIGGGGDFWRAARLSPEGRAMIALPSQSRGRSRIVPQLQAGTVSMARADADIIVTEHGVAHLRHLSMEQRAAQLIAIAAPEHQAALSGAWESMRSKM